MIGIDLTDALRLGIGITLFAEATLLVRRRPTLGIWILAIASVLSSLGITVPVNLRTTTVYLLDGVVMVLVAVLVMQVAVGWRFPTLLGGFGVLVGVGVVRGVDLSGIQGAFNASREMIAFVVVVAFVIVCIGADAWPTVERAWRILASGLVLWAAWFVLRNGLGTFAATGERGLNASQALLVGQAIVISMATGARRHLLFVSAGGLALVATQQRTALAATTVGVLVVVLRAGRLSSARASRVARVSVVGGVVAVMLAMLVGPSGLRESVGTAVSSVSTASGTFGWRIDGWRELLEDYSQSPLGDRLIGQPAGAGFGRYVGGGVVTVSPHNMYLTVLLTTGAAGLVLFGLLLVWALVRTRAGPVALHALVWSVIVFSVGYQLGPEMGIVIGAALAAPAAIVSGDRGRVAVSTPS